MKGALVRCGAGAAVWFADLYRDCTSDGGHVFDQQQQCQSHHHFPLLITASVLARCSARDWGFGWKRVRALLCVILHDVSFRNDPGTKSSWMIQSNIQGIHGHSQPSVQGGLPEANPLRSIQILCHMCPLQHPNLGC